MKHKVFAFFDAVVILIATVLVAILLIFFGFSKTGNTAVVSIEGEEVYLLSLNVDAEVQIKNDSGFNTVVVENGVCYVSEADCKDGICKKKGAVSKIGETIVCLPHKLIVEIK